jgi:hypothetical protein
MFEGPERYATSLRAKMEGGKRTDRENRPLHAGDDFSASISLILK